MSVTGSVRYRDFWSDFVGLGFGTDYWSGSLKISEKFSQCSLTEKTGLQLVRSIIRSFGPCNGSSVCFLVEARLKKSGADQ